MFDDPHVDIRPSRSRRRSMVLSMGKRTYPEGAPEPSTLDGKSGVYLTDMGPSKRSVARRVNRGILVCRQAEYEVERSGGSSRTSSKPESRPIPNDKK